MGANEIDKIAKRYRDLCELVPLHPIANKAGYDAAVGHLNRLLDAGGANETHALAGLVEALGEMIYAYESRLTPTGDVEPRGVLKYLMEEHQLNQSDLSDIASQGTISDILSGKRGISRALAKKLATRFHVSSATFL